MNKKVHDKDSRLFGDRLYRVWIEKKTRLQDHVPHYELVHMLPELLGWLRHPVHFLVSALCSVSLLAKAAFTFSRASGVIVCASLWNN
jgi:uncharacterized protein involved in cysteine biosynthesis